MNYQDSYEYEEDLEDLFDDDDNITDYYLIIDVANSKYGFKLQNIKEIIKLPDCKSFPEMKQYDRGLLKIREDIIRIIDLRKRLGYQSLYEEEKELFSIFEERKQDHIKWAEELKSCVIERREFKLTTDPNRCAFGQWYNKFHTDNSVLSMFLIQFYVPHKKIHAVGEKIRLLISNNQFDIALDLIQEMEMNELQTMIDLFNSLSEIMKEARREISVIFNIANKHFGFSADKVINILNINADEISEPDTIENNTYISGIGKKDNEVFLILDEEKLLISSGIVI
jgi:purine-binding chemotaxis protein CheW